MSRLSALNPTRRRQVVAAISAFMNLIVIYAVIRLNNLLMKKSVPIPNNCTSSRWKHFKKCLGALDGTHIQVRPLTEDKPRYLFLLIYCLAGWEGSAHDSRVLQDALTRPNGLVVPEGNYYLCDVGYANSPGFLTPYRGQRYHLKDWGNRQSETAEEYYNIKHSSARNVVERIFGVLKMRFAILRNATWFTPEQVSRIVIACCIIHNFIKKEYGVDEIERNYQDEEPEQIPSIDVETIDGSSMQPCAQWTQFCNEKATTMWANR
ncbi:unnamed protein product [Linum trigynum]|uniref:DDE Tnp4 domain-containing protein n=1 Tax=Linum trigynum TaxID=586398 RepID=A0AAV2G0D2_9ROSI